MTVIAAEQPYELATLWRRLRYPAIVIVIGLALITILAAIGRAPNTGLLDPRNDSPDGAHALAALLSDRGVSVTVANNLSQLDSSGPTTIVVANPYELSERALHAVASSSATVLLVDPLQDALSAFGVTAEPDAQTAATTIGPACTLPAAVTAGSARIAGDLYAVSGDDTACYLQGGDAALIESMRPTGGKTIVLGSPSTFSNAQLAAQGDAALALGLIDTPVVRWVPAGLDAGAAPKSQRGLINLLPARLLWATLMLFIAAVVLALWRARRLGPPVAEPLPVIVRAAETTEGRARLLHAGRARGAAARSLRLASVQRLSHILRLSPDEDSASITALVAERTTRPATEVSSLLYGGEPADDAALVHLARELSKLEASVHHDARSTTGGQQ
jgi:hypothetical protein